MRSKIFKICSLLVVILSFLYLKTSMAEEDYSCYQFRLPNVFANSRTQNIDRPEVWCYKKLNSDLFVFNADGDTVRPELSFIIDSSRVMTHGSLLNGDLTFHKVKASQYNPYSVPVQFPQEMTPIKSNKNIQFKKSAQKVLDLLKDQSQIIIIENISIQEGSTTAKIIPWRGYWWPYKGRPLSGSANSPLAKYDRFVEARTGTNPQAASWENANHKYRGVSWEGHCNGWAASSVLRREPSRSLVDPNTGILFSVSDQKGLLAETDYCANVAFFGSRYRGRNGDNIYDIDPVVFHKTINYYIGNLGKPVATDYHRDAAVDNHIISGYTINIKNTGSGAFTVTTTLRMHKYDSGPSNSLGAAPIYTRTYRYTLREGSNGSLSGAWLSENPDFLWVPLSVGDCGSNNPRVDHGWVAKILSL